MSKQFKISEDAVKQLVEFVEANLVTKFGRPILSFLEANLEEIAAEAAVEPEVLQD